MITATPSIDTPGTSTSRVRKGSILMIDDDPVILEMVGGRLRLEGYVVFTATSGEAALAMLHKITVNLIILDVSMPGLGGLGFLRQMTATFRPPPCPVVIFSARHELESFFQGNDIAAFIPKTCNPEAFVLRVNDLVAGHQAHTPRPETTLSKILLVEDDMDLGHHFVHFFTRHGFVVFHLPGGLTVRETAEERKPDVILIKYMLPHHNGPELAEILGTHHTTQSIPVVIYDETGLHSNRGQLRNVRVLISSGQDTHLLKAIRDITSSPYSAPQFR